jgi:SecD/SecF fusion protein
LQSRSYLFLLLVVSLGLISGVLYSITPASYGLDVRGGVRFVLSMDTDELTPEQKQNMPELRQNLHRILENRVTQGLGVVEGHVQTRDPDQFIIELPGETDIERARMILRTTASIHWYHARNIVTDQRGFRNYVVYDSTRMVDGQPVATFARRTDPAREITPDDPEYQQVIQGWGEPILVGDDLHRAEVAGPLPPNNIYRPTMRFSPAGARKIERWSRQHMDQGEYLAAVLDNRVISIAPLAPNTILRENAEITGDFEREYVVTLTQLLNSGALPVSLREESSQQVDPTIGATALDRIVVYGAVSFVFISLFLLVYYIFPGLVALVALLLYTLFTLTVLKLIGATFSLAAIAGFILSVGMAVDANILVFERVKEEMRAGKKLMSAIELGFRRALPAIIDSNACTILTSLVLLSFGTGPVRGFATTLIIGVAISLFTAITVTRSLMVFLVGSGLGSNVKWYGLNRNWFGEGFEKRAEHDPIKVIQHAKRYFLVSGLIILPGIIFMLMGGLRPSVEFRGGYEAMFTAGDRTAADIRGSLRQAGIDGANIKFANVEDQRLVYVTVPAAEQLGTVDEARPAVAQAAGFELEQLRDFSFVGPTVQAETVRNAILAVVISALLIIVYLAIRFGVAVGGFANGLRFGFSAIGALVHDVLFVIGFAAIVGYFVGWEVSALFITAMLTVIGFSVHDTIVIFDRIRENLRKPQPSEDFAHLTNRSISQSFARSINTSATTVLMLAILVIWGAPTPDLRFFLLVMLMGILVGTYSSIFNAAPILYLWDKAVGKRKGPDHTLINQARLEIERSKIVSKAIAPDVAGDPGYGQVRRKRSTTPPAKRGQVELDEEE